jgi:AraC-like DNA-binding protein
MASSLRTEPALQSDTRLKQHVALSRANLSIGAIDFLTGRELRHHFTPHMHEFFALGVIDGGATDVRYRGSHASATAGAIVAITAGETHTGGPAADQGWSYRMIYPQFGMFRTALGDSLAGDERLLFAQPFIADSDVRALFVQAYTSLVHAECELATEERVLMLLRLLATRHSSRPPRVRRLEGAARIVATARDYLRAHYAERVTLATVAGVCDVSPFHLIRLFRRECGMPPHAYLRQVRIARALTMLQHGGTVSHVAYSCGFSDQSHLTRTFKNTFGLPPGAYQRALGVAAVPAAN